MTGLIILIVIILIIGALLGGDSIGEMFRGGCGYLITIVVALIIAGIIFLN